jgi:hypothetical protein
MRSSANSWRPISEALTGSLRHLMLAVSVLLLILTGCGGGPSAPAPPWRAAHPDPQGITFDATAPGICAFAAQYPDDAPAAIEYLGSTYVQGGRTAPPPAVAPGTAVARSGDWTVTLVGHALDLVTAAALFSYRASNC